MVFWLKGFCLIGFKKMQNVKKIQNLGDVIFKNTLNKLGKIINYEA